MFRCSYINYNNKDTLPKTKKLPLFYYNQVCSHSSF